MNTRMPPPRQDPVARPRPDEAGWTTRPGPELAGGRHVRSDDGGGGRRRLWFIAGGGGAAVVVLLALLSGRSAAVAPPAATPAPQPPMTAPTVLFISRDPASLDRLATVPVVDPGEPPVVVSGFTCVSVDFRGGRGVCLSTDSGGSTAIVFDASWSVLSRHPLSGTPALVRVSPDGHTAAITLITRGAALTDAAATTSTIVLDLGSDETLGTVESFAAYQHGLRLATAGASARGLTWTGDSNGFLATLATPGHHYLVQGDLRRRSLTVVGDGVELPSLSPDGSRFADDRVVPGGARQLEVRDTATLQVVSGGAPVCTGQAQWLDAGDLLYDGDAGNVMTIATAGDGATEYLGNAAAAVAVRP